jgi:hypothetical protein
MDARLKPILTAILYLRGLVPMNGSSTVEGCTKHRWLRNDGIRHGHVIPQRNGRSSSSENVLLEKKATGSSFMTATASTPVIWTHPCEPSV